MSAAKRTWVALVFAMAMAPSFAQKTVDDRKAELDAQIELLRKEAELNAALRSVAGSTALGMPAVVSVAQVDGKGVARLQLPNGIVSHFREGDHINSQMVVNSISSARVFVSIKRGKKEVVIPLDYVAVAGGTGPGTAAGTAGMGGIPAAPLPPELLPPPPVVMPHPVTPGPAAKLN